MRTGESGNFTAGWMEAELRIWCMGGWRFHLRGKEEVHEVGGPAAEEALFRHLAARHPFPVPDHELRMQLSRKRNRPIPKQSLHVAANKLRDLLAKAAGGSPDAKALAKRLLPPAVSGTAADGSRSSMYGFDPGVWVDIRNAAEPLAFRTLPADRASVPLGGGERAQVFTGFEQLAEEVRARLDKAGRPTRIELPRHLKKFTPPIRRLAHQIPLALDRLQPNAMLVIQGEGESGRMHLAEAIELATLAWCGRGAEQIRDQPDEDLRPELGDQKVFPGHLYILDLTRETTEFHRQRLRAIRDFADRCEDPTQRPSLLVVSAGAKAGFSGWERAEAIELEPPQAGEVAEAYLIATRGLPRDHEQRRSEFERLAKRYAGERDTEIGLRAAASAASIAVDEDRLPLAEELPSPEADDLDPDQLEGEEKRLAHALAWFRNDPFTLEDARAATGHENLPRSDIFRIATKIPGGGAGAYEIRPPLIEMTPAAEAPEGICRYLLEDGSREIAMAREEAIERWPSRAVRILAAESVALELRMRLALKLVNLARDLGFAGDLEERMEGLLEGTRDRKDPLAIEVAIGRARLLIYLGRLVKAEAVLKPITRERSKRLTELRAEAYLRLAIAASQRGKRGLANKWAAQADKLAPKRMGDRVRRYHGWEALYTARFEDALKVFKRSLPKEREAENHADAAIGAVLGLLRLGRLKEGEELLAELEDAPRLRRTTRNRIVRAEATAQFLRRGPRYGIEILDKALGQGESRVTRQSADLLEARAYLRTQLGPASLPAAAQDLKRCRRLLNTEDEWQNAVLYYLEGLIAEASMHADPHAAEEFRDKARESATKSVVAARANPWHQVRAQTLLGRLEVGAGGDRKRLAEHLQAASAKHRELAALSPDALRETVELGAAAAGAWQMRDEQLRLEDLAARLAPRDEPDPGFPRDEALDLLDEIAAAVGSRPRPTPQSDREANLRALGKLGEALLQGAKEALSHGRPLSIRLLHPRQTPDFAAGVYDVDLASGDLTPTPGLPTNGSSILKGAANQRFAAERLGAVVLIGAAADGRDGGALFLGQWLEAFRANARRRGIATIESLAIEPAALQALELRPAEGFLVLGLAELPALGMSPLVRPDQSDERSAVAA